MHSSEAMDCFVGEQLVLCRDDHVGLRAAIAINDTTLGPGLGGVRCIGYPSETAAITEAQRLGAAMTLKNASAGLPYGGAKSVILAPDPSCDRAALMRRFGEFILRTGGAYLPGVDMGTTVEDLATIGACGAEVSCSQEDPSPWTARGLYAAVRAAVEHVEQRDSVDQVRVLIQGVGHVGGALARSLAADGAQVTLTDVDSDRARRLARQIDGRVIGPDQMLSTECDVFAPCAAARVLSATTIPQLRCRIVVPAANDTLADERDAQRLAAAGITYVPDFIANAGGVIHIHALRAHHDKERLRADVERIGERVRGLLEEADASAQTPLAVALARVRETLERAHAERAHADQLGAGPSRNGRANARSEAARR